MMADICQRHRELEKAKGLPSVEKKDAPFYSDNASDYFHLCGEAFWYHRARAYCMPKQYPFLSVFYEKHESASALFQTLSSCPGRVATGRCLSPEKD